MADRTQLKVADRDSFSNDDPFAELTRIMGFDPREPARSSEQEAVDNIIADDFGIDLEKELMGEFGEGAQDGEVPAYAPAPQYDQRSEPVYQEPAYAQEAAYEQGPAYAQDDAAQQVEEDPASSFAAVAGHEAPEAYRYAPDVAVDATFEGAIAASMEDELALSGEWEQAEPAQAATFAHAAAHDVAFEPEYGQPAAYDDPNAGFEELAARHQHADQSERGYDYDAAGDWQPAEEFEAQPAQETVSIYEPEPALDLAVGIAGQADDDGFAEDFAAALAEVDMDFTAAPLMSSGGPTFESEFGQEPAYDEESVQEAAPVAAFDHAAPASPAMSLEDELNALLGNMSAPQAAAPVAYAAPAAQYEPEVETAYESDAADPAAVVGYQYEQEAYPQQEAVAHSPEVAGADEFDLGLSEQDFLGEGPAVDHAFASARPEYTYSRGNFRIQPAEQYHQVPVTAEETAPVAEYEEPAFNLAAPVEAVSYAAETEFEPATAAPEEADFDLSFDDDDFDAAFAKSIEEPASYAAETQLGEEPQAEAAEESDPYAELAALTKSFASAPSAPASWGQDTDSDSERPNSRSDQMGYDPSQNSAGEFDQYPYIETVDVPEQAVALADDLDLPELTFEEDVPSVAAYDDIDAEFNTLLNEMNAPEPSAPAPAAAAVSLTDDLMADFEREFRLEGEGDQSGNHAHSAAAVAGAAAAAAALGTAAQRSYAQPAPASMASGDVFGAAAHGQQQPPAFQFDSGFDDELPADDPAGEVERPKRRGALIAAIIGGVVVLGGVGAYALSGSGGSGLPAVIKADEGPVKVRPENPGGTVIPNQDNKVYETVAQAPSGEPTQQKLVTTAEKPVDLAAQEAPADDQGAVAGAETAAPTGKSEERIEPAVQGNAGAAPHTEIAAVAPRKVRTMIVRADGTLVPREDPAPAPALAPVAAANPAPAAATPAAPAAAEPMPAEARQAPAPQAAVTPASVAVAPSRPSDQPVDVVGEVKPDQVAMNASAASAGEWAMQIASQPSEAAAKSSYQDLLRKYGSVLNGRPVNIVKAEISGKGTFYRVRVPAPTRNDAITLCESYKAAGGNCFVSK